MRARVDLWRRQANGSPDDAQRRFINNAFTAQRQKQDKHAQANSYEPARALRSESVKGKAKTPQKLTKQFHLHRVPALQSNHTASRTVLHTFRCERKEGTRTRFHGHSPLSP